MLYLDFCDAPSFKELIMEAFTKEAEPVKFKKDLGFVSKDNQVFRATFDEGMVVAHRSSFNNVPFIAILLESNKDKGNPLGFEMVGETDFDLSFYHLCKGLVSIMNLKNYEEAINSVFAKFQERVKDVKEIKPFMFALDSFMTTVVALGVNNKETPIEGRKEIPLFEAKTPFQLFIRDALVRLFDMEPLLKDGKVHIRTSDYMNVILFWIYAQCGKLITVMTSNIEENKSVVMTSLSLSLMEEIAKTLEYLGTKYSFARVLVNLDTLDVQSVYNRYIQLAVEEDYRISNKEEKKEDKKEIPAFAATVFKRKGVVS